MLRASFGGPALVWLQADGFHGPTPGSERHALGAPAKVG
jgi:hypothetical protein